MNTAMGTVVTQKLYTEGDDVTGDVEQLLSGMEETRLARLFPRRWLERTGNGAPR